MTNVRPTLEIRPTRPPYAGVLTWTRAEGGAYLGTLRPWHLALVPGTDDLWAVGQRVGDSGVGPYAESYGD